MAKIQSKCGREAVLLGYCTKDGGHSDPHSYKTYVTPPSCIPNARVSELEHSLSKANKEISRLNKHINMLDATIEGQKANTDFTIDTLNAITARAERAEAMVDFLLDYLENQACMQKVT